MKKILLAALSFLMLLTTACSVESLHTYTLQTALPQTKIQYPTGHGRTYYISAEGSDENSGFSEQEPLRSYCITPRAGDTVLFRAGDTFEGQVKVPSGEDGNPITIASYGDANNGRAILTSDIDVVLTENASNVVVRDLELIPGANGNGIYFYFTQGSGYKNLYAVNNYIHGLAIENRTHGIHCGSSSPDMHNIASNIIIEENTVQRVRSGITSRAGNTLDTFRNIYINGNTVSEVGNIGIYIGDCTGGTINRNTVFQTGLDNGFIEGQCGIMAIAASNIDIFYNEIYECYPCHTHDDAMGIDIDWYTYFINVQYNHSFNNMGSGIGTMSNHDSTISNNFIENNARDKDVNGEAQIFIIDFCAPLPSIDTEEPVNTVSRLKIENNLIINQKENQHVFSTMYTNSGNNNWEDNTFIGNHIVNYADPKLWYHRGNRNDDFTVADNQFFTEQKNAPSKAEIQSITANGADITVTFTAENAWRTNLFLTKDYPDQKIPYTALYGQTDGDTITFTAEEKGDYYLTLQTVSDDGFMTNKTVKLVLE